MGVLRDEDVTWEDLEGFLISFSQDFYKLGERSEENIESTKGNERL